MSSAAPAFVGIDVAKAELVIAIRPSGERWTTANDVAGIQRLKKIKLTRDTRKPLSASA